MPDQVVLLLPVVLAAIFAMRTSVKHLTVKTPYLQ